MALGVEANARTQRENFASQWNTDLRPKNDETIISDSPGLPNEVRKMSIEHEATTIV